MQYKQPSEGGFRSLWLLFLPLVGTTFCNGLFIFLEKLFLTRVSQEALEAALNITYASQIFQTATVSLVMMGQVYVGRWFGAGDKEKIGPGIWQFVWFSLLSMLVTVPLSLIYGMWYFHGIEIKETALPYFYIQTFLSFLYPLTASFSCFFLGQGKTKIVLIVNSIDQVIKIALSYLLIFGFNPFIQPIGILGGVVSNFIAQALLCITLGYLFLKKHNRDEFHTNLWQFKPQLFWECVNPGLFRALNRIFSYASWAAIAHLMATKGGDYILILSLGGSLSLFLPFFFDAIFQSQTILISQLIGARAFSGLAKALRSSFYLVSGCALIVAVPFLCLYEQTFDFLFQGIILNPNSIKHLFLGVWLWFAYFTFAAIPLSFILAFKDTQFYFYTGIIFWFTDYFLMAYFIEYFNIAPHHFWTILSIVQMTSTLPIYFLRMLHLKRRNAVALA